MARVTRHLGPAAVRAAVPELAIFLAVFALCITTYYCLLTVGNNTALTQQSNGNPQLLCTAAVQAASHSRLLSQLKRQAPHASGRCRCQLV